MTLVGYHLSGKQPAGTDATSANTGLGTFTLTGGTAKWTTPNDAVRFTNVTGNTSTRTNLATTSNQSSYRVRFRLNNVPTSATGFFTVRHSAGRAAACLIDTNTASPRIFFSNTVNTFGGAAWIGLSLNTIYELVFWLDVAAGTGKARLYTANGTGLTPNSTASTYGSVVGNDINFSGYNFGTNPIANFEVGAAVATVQATFDILDVQVDDGSQSEIPMYVAVTNTAPTASAGTNKVTAVGTAISLTGTDSDSDGTVASRLWTFMDSVPATATVPTITGATTATPSVTPTVPGKFRYKYVVTDNSGASSPDAFTYLIGTSTTAKAAAVVGTTEFTTIAGTDLVSNVTDGATNTGISYPPGATGIKSIRYKLTPLPVLSTLSIPVTRRLAQAGSGTLTVKLYQGATVKFTWTNVVNSTTLDSATLTHLNGTGDLTSISDWTELDLEFTWGS
jgi:hypothetical protein